MAPYVPSFDEGGPAVSGASMDPASLKVSRIEPRVTGPLGSAKVNGFPCQSYTIRVEVDFSNAGTGQVVATETLLEKLWVTEKAASVVQFRKAEERFSEDLLTQHRSEQLTLGWLLRTLNKQLLEMNGNPEDFKKIQAAYRGARAQIQGVTVRQLAAWSWQPKAEGAPGASGEITEFVASLAAGLGAPPESDERKPLASSERPFWVIEMEKTLGATGPTVMMLNEVLEAGSVKTDGALFEAPETYRKL